MAKILTRAKLLLMNILNDCRKGLISLARTKADLPVSLLHAKGHFPNPPCVRNAPHNYYENTPV